jgi:hypothetical protein
MHHCATLVGHDGGKDVPAIGYSVVKEHAIHFYASAAQFRLIWRNTVRFSLCLPSCLRAFVAPYPDCGKRRETDKKARMD